MSQSFYRQMLNRLQVREREKLKLPDAAEV